MTPEIIGAGFGRTGTDSMREALNILGFGPCHHMFEVTENPIAVEFHGMPSSMLRGQRN